MFIISICLITVEACNLDQFVNVYCSAAFSGEVLVVHKLLDLGCDSCNVPITQLVGRPTCQQKDMSVGRWDSDIHAMPDLLVDEIGDLLSPHFRVCPRQHLPLCFYVFSPIIQRLNRILHPAAVHGGFFAALGLVLLILGPLVFPVLHGLACRDRIFSRDLWETKGSPTYNVPDQSTRGVRSMSTVKRGEIYYADLSPVVGSEQGGVRPVLIVQNDTGNRHSPTVIAAAITSKLTKAKLPTHIRLSRQTTGLNRDSIILLEQIRTLDKSRLRERMGQLDESTMSAVDNALSVSFGLQG